MAPMSGPRVSWKGTLKALHRVSLFPRTYAIRNAPDDKHDTKRILPDGRLHEGKGELDVLGFLVLCPLLQVLGDVDDVVQDVSDLREVGVVLGLAQVALERLLHLLLMVLDAAGYQ